MAAADVFVFKNSGLNAFLFAEVGTELNGSPLTILSVLARLGQDPWAEAANWAKLPKSATIDRLAQSISQMPLSPQALGEARTTATRLIKLLPSQVARPTQPAGGKQEGGAEMGAGCRLLCGGGAGTCFHDNARLDASQYHGADQRSIRGTPAGSPEVTITPPS